MYVSLRKDKGVSYVYITRGSIRTTNNFNNNNNGERKFCKWLASDGRCDECDFEWSVASTIT